MARGDQKSDINLEQMQSKFRVYVLTVEPDQRPVDVDICHDSQRTAVTLVHPSNKQFDTTSFQTTGDEKAFIGASLSTDLSNIVVVVECDPSPNSRPSQITLPLADFLAEEGRGCYLQRRFFQPLFTQPELSTMG